MMLDEWIRPDDGDLARYVRDLTAEARAGRLEPVCCRDDEISRVVDILLRQSKNNPALVGAAGVGKTAIAEGLAHRIVAGAVPRALEDCRLLALDHVSLLAGTMFRGQYEDRLKTIVKQASTDPRVILFIDELHNLIGQGSSMGSAMDAANMLKPALVRGDFRVIGATTDEEYDRWVRGDPALERRFQRIAVGELSADQSLDVLRSRRERLERHHGLAISDDAILASVRLTDAFITDRARPDRAIDALDEACAHVQARATLPPDVLAMLTARRDLEAALSVEGAPASRQAPAPEPKAAAPGDDPIERIARDGVAALERLGLELEAVFAGAPTRRAESSPRPPSTAPGAAAPNPEEIAGKLRQVEWELRRRLIDAGLIVRGHDVARVVSVASGQRVEWKP
jgi:ATP-dependent Clp protease ATP-binding subunit ClpA